MKIKLLSLLCVFATTGSFLYAGAGQEATTTPGLRITSPDHPATWEVGFNDKVSQRLRWSDSDGKLLLDVNYSMITYTNTIPPSDFRTYTLAFPGVSKDTYGNFFVLNNHKQKIIIGSLTSGPFGTEVSLKKGIALSAHRQHGRINAMLLSEYTR